MCQIVPYQRERALEYAKIWSFRRNPNYYDFSDIGGDCTNFISQCLYYANPIMNETQHVGWYYYSVHHRSAAWTGVSFLYRFLMENKGAGPFACLCSLDQLQPGDLIQFANAGRDWHHTLLVIEPGDWYEKVLIATHTVDAYRLPLSSYHFVKVRFLHIEGFRQY